jgi:hypothetical protein
MIEYIIAAAACVIAAGLIVLLVYLICHPETLFLWNTFISGKLAAVMPEKRKKAFEMNINKAAALSAKLFLKAY